ncbi:hypothetical protein Bpfe_006725 [Biomphalaria pfeifferi]|uniref:Uncharacterized protein n=1 Tax=Biomphalaria pfeifferi TaxID=112525 RepID=A0AAD8FH00_BIOPF|nr:hypothetical protein Bpfe_006725 [Biomphalaria pfeifferi]
MQVYFEKIQHGDTTAAQRKSSASVVWQLCAFSSEPQWCQVDWLKREIFGVGEGGQRIKEHQMGNRERGRQTRRGEGGCGSGALTSSFSTQSKIPRSKLSKDSKYLDQLSGPIALDEKNMQI